MFVLKHQKHQNLLPPLAGAVEYTDWISAEGVRPPQRVSWTWCRTVWWRGPSITGALGMWRTNSFVLFWPLTRANMPFQSDAPEGSDTSQWPVIERNRIGGIWLMKWDKAKKSHGTLIDWCTGREWPVNCMTVISTWWRSNMPFQRLSGRLSGHWTII